MNRHQERADRPTGDGEAVSASLGGAGSESTARPRRSALCAAGVGLSPSADLLAGRLATGAELPPADLDRIVNGECSDQASGVPT
jgi:hypothetical protein